MKVISIFLCSLIFFSFSESPNNMSANSNNKNNQSEETVTETFLGKTGFSIYLPSSYKSEVHKGPDFLVYYITPIDTTLHKGGAGIYFGSNPDSHGPESAVSKNVVADSALNKNATVTTYVTPTYTWIETLVNESDSSKIQFWYFANDPRELGFLGNVMKTLDRVKNDSLK